MTTLMFPAAIAVSAPAALIATGTCSFLAAALVAGLVVALQFVAAKWITATAAQYIRCVSRICLAFVLAFRLLPTALAPTCAAVVFFPRAAWLSAPFALLGLVLSVWVTNPSTSVCWPVLDDAFVLLCATAGMLGATWQQCAVTIVWGTVLHLVHPAFPAMSAVFTAAFELSEIWKVFEAQLLQLTVPSSSAAQLLFVIACSSVAAAAASVQTCALAAVYTLVGTTVCFGVSGTVILGSNMLTIGFVRQK